MLTQPVVTEIKAAVRAKPGQTCYDLQNGIFVVLQGDTSCCHGDVRLSESLEVDGTSYDIYVGGTRTESAS